MQFPQVDWQVNLDIQDTQHAIEESALSGEITEPLSQRRNSLFRQSFAMNPNQNALAGLRRANTQSNIVQRNTADDPKNKVIIR